MMLIHVRAYDKRREFRDVGSLARFREHGKLVLAAEAQMEVDRV